MVIYNKKMKIMKKLIFTTMAISALFLSVSCQKENVKDAPKGKGVVFTAYVDGVDPVDPDTKTVIGKNESNETVSKWSGDERIWILNGNNTWKKAFVATAAEPSEKVIFSEESSFRLSFPYSTPRCFTTSCLSRRKKAVSFRIFKKLLWLISRFTGF